MIYLDNSIVVSLFSLETNSAAAVSLFRAVEEKLLISTLVEAEVVNAFGLKEFRREISHREAELTLQNFQKAVRNGVFLLRAIPEAAFERAKVLSLKFTPQLGTRTADILHVAAALEMGAASFFSYDVQQRKLAEYMGLIINPLP